MVENQSFMNSNGGISFEFIPRIAYNNPNGLTNVSAIANYDIRSSALNKLFYFQLTNPLLIDLSNTDIGINNDLSNNIINYGINNKFKFNIFYSQSKVIYTEFLNNDIIAKDYLCHLAYYLTRTKNIGIFYNATQLINGISILDVGFNIGINNSIAYYGNTDNSNNIFLSNDITNPFIHSTKQLVTGMLSIPETDRQHVFYNDLVQQSENNTENIYWVPFHTGDKMSVFINYAPTYGATSRNYKIILNCIENLVFPYSVSNVGYNPIGSLDPFYIFNQLKTIEMSQNPNTNINLDSSFVTIYNSVVTKFKNPLYSTFIRLFKEIGFILNPLDLYYKTFLSTITQPSIVQNEFNRLKNNGINPSFQYIYLNSTITTLIYPSLFTIKTALLTSPYNVYPTLNDIEDIQCDLNCDVSNGITSNFIIRVVTRPIYTQIQIDDINPNDSFFGNYYDSGIFQSSDYKTYHLNELFTYWQAMLNTPYNQPVYYKDGYKTLVTYGQQEILSICILTYNNNANIGIKNIIVTYK